MTTGTKVRFGAGVGVFQVWRASYPRDRNSLSGRTSKARTSTVENQTGSNASQQGHVKPGADPLGRPW